MKTIGFIGMGNMARAMVKGFLTGGACDGSDIFAYAPRWERLRAFADETGIQPCRSLSEMLERADVVIMAVKPYVIESVLAEAREELKNKVLISVAYGWNLDRYAPLLDVSTHVQTIMPNVPCEVTAGMTLVEDRSTLTAEEREFVLRLLSALGETELLPSSKMDAAMAISGCGPAFMAMIMESLADAGVKYGLTRAQAYHLASQTMVGSGKLQLATNVHPAQLKDAVCSPGGSTIRGVEALEQTGLRASMLAAVKAVVEG